MANGIEVQLSQISPSASEATIGKHRLSIDRPESKGGAGAGPMGGELFLAAIGGCFMSNLLAAVHARNADVKNIRTEVVGTVSQAPSRFSAVELLVSAECADRESLQRLVEIADRGCIMMNTLRGTLDLSIRIS